MEIEWTGVERQIERYRERERERFGERGGGGVRNDENNVE